MLRIFTTPSIMQNYVSDPITYYFTDKLCQVDPDLILEETSNRIYIREDHRVFQILENVISNYTGFRQVALNDGIRWIHSMKPSRMYCKNRLVVDLRSSGKGYLEFSTEIQHGKKLRKNSGFSLFGLLALISFFILLGVAGSYEINSITTFEFFKYASVSLGSFGVFAWLEQRFNPIIFTE